MYTPERGIDLDMLRYDVKYLKKRYSLDVKGKSEGRLVIRWAYLLKVGASREKSDGNRVQGTRNPRKFTPQKSSQRSSQKKVASSLTLVSPLSDIPYKVASLRRLIAPALCGSHSSVWRSLKSSTTFS